MAAVQAKVWGEKTFKQLAANEYHHIHKEVKIYFFKIYYVTVFVMPTDIPPVSSTKGKERGSRQSPAKMSL